MAIREEFFFPSNDGQHRVHALRWLPDGESPRAVLQLVHGISEYIGRYDPFAAWLADQGFLVVGHDHLGHGQTAVGPGELGFLAPQNGWRYLVEDIRTLRVMMDEQVPGLPYFLLGHSMGSFAVRTYLIDYPGTVDGCILSGTGQESPAILFLGQTVARLARRIRGPKHISRVLTALTLGGYNAGFRPARTGADWISRDTDIVDTYVADPLCRFVPTTGMFLDMADGLRYISSPQNLRRMDPDTPVYLFSGEEDPVGGRGEGVKTVDAFFRVSGCRDHTVRLYENGRHEMLNEINREEVYQDILDWLEAHLSSEKEERPRA